MRTAGFSPTTPLISLTLAPIDYNSPPSQYSMTILTSLLLEFTIRCYFCGAFSATIISSRTTCRIEVKSRVLRTFRAQANPSCLSITLYCAPCTFIQAGYNIKVVITGAEGGRGERRRGGIGMSCARVGGRMQGGAGAMQRSAIGQRIPSGMHSNKAGRTPGYPRASLPCVLSRCHPQTAHAATGSSVGA